MYLDLRLWLFISVKIHHEKLSSFYNESNKGQPWWWHAICKTCFNMIQVIRSLFYFIYFFPFYWSAWMMAAVNLAVVNQFSTAEAFHVLCCDFSISQNGKEFQYIFSLAGVTIERLSWWNWWRPIVSVVFPLKFRAWTGSTNIHIFPYKAPVILYFSESDFENCILVFMRIMILNHFVICYVA